MSMQLWYLVAPLAPLAGALIAGLCGRQVGRFGAHRITIALMILSFCAACVIANDVIVHGHVFNGGIYTWTMAGDARLEIGFLIDRLTVLMMLVVSFVSLMVHIYTVGYMADDPGYQRFFSYISLFTFSMLMLVMSNNFLQLFFGWEAVGLVSYLLIGFWYTRPTAVYANLKAFIVNRIGDFGFLLGIGLILAYFGSLDYAAVFGKAGAMKAVTVEIFPGAPWLLMSVVCICLFIGAMGKSAQFPLHVWLPDSMEGPTPISALIHAATMVTAGIFMVARMSPLFELSDTARSFVMVIGGITTFFMALIALVQYDIKRVVAYSTLSQLGYMTVALGASAYGFGIFHLMTHAFFKAVLFLGAGSVIVALHHEQDMRKMGGLRKYMPITYWTVMVGSLANAAVPGFAGFFSKDLIIEAAKDSHIWGASFAYACVLGCAAVTAFYTFRMVFMAFHGTPRMDEHTREHLHESPWVITLPLVLLAIPSVLSGYWIGEIPLGDFFGSSIYYAPEHDTVRRLAEEFHGAGPFILQGLASPPFWLTLAGIAGAVYLYLISPGAAQRVRHALRIPVWILEKKYGIDDFNQNVLADGTVEAGKLLWQVGDVQLIDGLAVNGSARAVGWFAGVVRTLQSGLIYHYAFAMIAGAFVLLTVWLWIVVRA
jgi:NADH-quinone oxidoreductase subunit L